MKKILIHLNQLRIKKSNQRIKESVLDNEGKGKKKKFLTLIQEY